MLAYNFDVGTRKWIGNHIKINLGKFANLKIHFDDRKNQSESMETKLKPKKSDHLLANNHRRASNKL